MVLLPQPDTPITTMTEVSAASGSGGIEALGCGGTIDEPGELAIRPHAACGQVVALEHALKDLALLFALHKEQHFPGGCECGKGQCDARHERLKACPIDADHPALLFEQGRSMREQGSGVPIGTKTHQDDLEQRPCRIEPIASVEALEVGLVAARRSI